MNTKIGNSGNRVKKIQEKVGVNTDGIFGAKTKSAVMDFQRANGLKVDGIVGKNTSAALFDTNTAENNLGLGTINLGDVGNAKLQYVPPVQQEAPVISTDTTLPTDINTTEKNSGFFDGYDVAKNGAYQVPDYQPDAKNDTKDAQKVETSTNTYSGLKDTAQIEKDVNYYADKVYNSSYEKENLNDKYGVNKEIDKLQGYQDAQTIIPIEVRDHLTGKGATMYEFDAEKAPMLRNASLAILAQTRKVDSLTRAINSKIDADYKANLFMYEKKQNDLDNFLKYNSSVITAQEKTKLEQRKYENELKKTLLKTDADQRKTYIKQILEKGSQKTGDELMSMSTAELLGEAVRNSNSGSLLFDKYNTYQEAYVAGGDKFAKAWENNSKIVGAKNATYAKASFISKTIDDLLDNEDGLGRNVGATKLQRLKLNPFNIGDGNMFKTDLQSLYSQLTLQTLSDLKATGASMGALNAKEGGWLENANTRLGFITETDDEDNKKVVGSRLPEKVFKKRLRQLQMYSKKIRIAKELGETRYDESGLIDVEDPDVIDAYYDALSNADSFKQTEEDNTIASLFKAKTAYADEPNVVENLFKAISEKESNGNYNARGATIKSGMYKGQRAMGKYQVMPGNLSTAGQGGNWDIQALGRPVTEEEYMANPDIQDAIAKKQIEKAWNKYGTIEDVASVWFSGGSYAKNKSKKDNTINLSVEKYVNDFKNIFNNITGAKTAYADGIDREYQRAIAIGISPKKAKEISDRLSGVENEKPTNPFLLEKINPFNAKNIIDRVKDIPDDIMAYGESLRNTFNSTVDSLSDPLADYITGDIGFGRAAYRYTGEFLGGIAGAVADTAIGAASLLTTEEQENTIKEKLGKIMNSDSITSLKNGYDSWVEKNPERAKDLSATMGIVDFLTLAGVEAVAKQGVKAGEKAIIRGGSEIEAIFNRTADIVEAEYKTIKKAGADKIKSVGKSIKGNIPSVNVKDMNLGEALLDNAVVGADKAIKGAKNITKKISDTVSKSVDRQNIKLVKNSPTKAKEKIIDLYQQSIVPGVKGKKKTVKNINKINKSIPETTQKLAKIKKVESVQDFAEVIVKSKKKIWGDIEKQLEKATKKGVKISLKPIVDDLKKALKHEMIQFNPDMKKAIDKQLSLFTHKNGRAKMITPTTAQDLMASNNQILSPYFRGSSVSGKAIVDGLVMSNVNKNLKDIVDGAIDALDGKKFGQLKKEYSNLKNIENDVVHRAVFEAQKGAGLGSYADAFAAGDIIGGMIGMNPAFLAKGIGQKVMGDIVKALNNKDELVRQMFNIAEELNLQGSKGVQKLPVRKVKSYSNDITKTTKGKGRKINKTNK